MCSTCNAVANTRVIHCQRCDLCFDGMDHHCVWANKCIAAGNMFEFGLFIFSIIVLFVYSIAMSYSAAL